MIAALSFPIHASAVLAGGGGLAFLGPSETGKSTVSLMMGAAMPQLADDAVYLLYQAGRWQVTVGDVRAFSGPLPIAEAAALTTVPLWGIFRLFRAEEPRLERVSPLELCRYLIEAFFDLYWPVRCDCETKKVAFADLAGVARTVPGYRLYFDRSSRTKALIRDAARSLAATLPAPET